MNITSSDASRREWRDRFMMSSSNDDGYVSHAARMSMLLRSLEESQRKEINRQHRSLVYGDIPKANDQSHRYKQE